MSYSMVRMRCFLVFTRLLFFGSLEWNLFLDIFGIGLKFYFLSQKQLDRSRTMSQNIQICHPPSQKSSHAWGWFPWIPLLVPSHYASEVANVFTQNCSRYVDIALTYHLHSPISFPYVFSVFFHMFPIFFQDPIQSESLEPKRPCRNDRPTVHRGEPSANTATNRDVVLDRSRAKRRVQNVAQTWRSAEAKQNLEMFWVSAYYKMIITQIVTSSCKKNVTDYIICNVVLLYCNILYETYYIKYIDVELMLNYLIYLHYIIIYYVMLCYIIHMNRAMYISEDGWLQKEVALWVYAAGKKKNTR